MKTNNLSRGEVIVSMGLEHHPLRGEGLLSMSYCTQAGLLESEGCYL